MRVRQLFAAACAVALVAAACSGDDGDEVSTGDDGSAETAAPATLPDYGAELAALPEAANDASLPDVAPETGVGAYGFSRYVYQQQGDQVVATLIEGPLGEQTRCQDLDKDCSYLELKALYDSGTEVPEYLNMDRETLGELVGQLDRVQQSVMRYPTLEDACAAGFSVQSTQNANMGIHVINPAAGRTFDVDEPQMILYAKDGGEVIPRSELGRCQDGSFTGEPGFEAVGAVFNIELSDEHPDAFAGELDNWHIHYNTCGGSEIENADVIEAEPDTNATTVTKEQCEESGGFFIPVVSSWMMHAYVVPEYDPQGGVFSMFNPNIWPLADSPDDIRDQRTIGDGEATAAPIVNFDFGDVTAGVGETIRFANSDSVPHTVTAGTALDPGAEFDSGLLGTGQTFDLTFDEPGEYALFCVLHPEMQGIVTVQ